MILVTKLVLFCNSRIDITFSLFMISLVIYVLKHDVDHLFRHFNPDVL